LPSLLPPLAGCDFCASEPSPPHAADTDCLIQDPVSLRRCPAVLAAQLTFSLAVVAALPKRSPTVGSEGVVLPGGSTAAPPPPQSVRDPYSPSVPVPRRPPPQLLFVVGRLLLAALHSAHTSSADVSTAVQTPSLAAAPARDPATAPPMAPAREPTSPKALPRTADPAMDPPSEPATLPPV
jgi:hypothetical protein